MIDEKKLLAFVLMTKLTAEVLDIVINDHPEIVIKTIVQVVEKNPGISYEEFLV